MFSSEEPTHIEKMRPMSSWISGTPALAATHLAVSDLPQPGMPVTRTPLGLWMP
jgi:hypothetical protein